jgi:hypothetical protein
LEAIELGLKLRFGAEGLQCFPAFQSLVDISLLRRVKQAIETAATLDEVRKLLPSLDNRNIQQESKQG